MPTDTMNDTAALKAIHEYLDEHPGDTGVRLELADLYADLGDEWRERLQRWLVKNGKYPVHRLNYWDWYSAIVEYGERCRLTWNLYDKLTRNGRYDTREEAEDDLALVLFSE